MAKRGGVSPFWRLMMPLNHVLGRKNWLSGMGSIVYKKTRRTAGQEKRKGVRTMR